MTAGGGVGGGGRGGMLSVPTLHSGSLLKDVEL